MSERLRAPDLIPHFLNVRANLLAHTGRIAEALATPIDRNLADSLGRQLERTGRILSRLWDPAHGKPWLLEGVRLPAVEKARTAGFGPNTDYRALDETLAIMHVMTGNLEDARALVDRAPSTLLRGMIAIHGGDWTEAKSVLETGLSITRASGARERHADLSFWYARLLRITGQTVPARAFLDDALQIFGEGSLPLVEMWLRSECILSSAGKGRRAVASRALSRDPRIAGGLARTRWRCRASRSRRCRGRESNCRTRKHSSNARLRPSPVTRCRGNKPRLFCYGDVCLPPATNTARMRSSVQQ